MEDLTQESGQVILKEKVIIVLRDSVPVSDFSLVLDPDHQHSSKPCSSARYTLTPLTSIFLRSCLFLVLLEFY